MKRSWTEANGASSVSRTRSNSNHTSTHADLDITPARPGQRSKSFGAGTLGPQSGDERSPGQSTTHVQTQTQTRSSPPPPPKPAGSNNSAPPRTGTSLPHDLIPAISRKVTACAACRKQKIKCRMENDEPPCTRCIQRGLSCVLNRSLQSLVNDTRQIEALQGDVINLHSILSEVCQNINLKPPPPLQIPTPNRSRSEDILARMEDQEQDPDAADASPPMSPSDMQAPIDTFLETAPKVAESPTSAVVESPRGSVTSRKAFTEPDLITKGIISAVTAENLVNRYLQRLDHYLYGIGSIYADFKGLRKGSPVLLAAVCTISALHDEKDLKVYELCTQEFLNLVSRSLFEQRGVEFLRALCIGSFWLSHASRILNSDGLRRSADVRLQKYFYQVTVPDPTIPQPGGILPPAVKVDRVRLWYLFYICDQHLSILYNRDPVVHGNQDIILGWEAFLESGFTDDSDIRIVSQVSLLHTMSQIRTAFGPESIEPVPKALATSFNNFNRQIDQWFARFSGVFKTHEKIGDFPYKGLTLHYHFAKLYLGHHVFRGLKSEPIPVYFLPAALMAHSAAISIFEFIVNDVDLTNSLVGVPFYFHVMISFAGHFLLSCSQYREQLSVDVENDLALMSKAIQLFKSVPCIIHHPLQKMAAALERKQQECHTIFGRNGIDTLANLAAGHQQANVTQWTNSIPPPTGLSESNYGNSQAPISSGDHLMNPPSTTTVSNMYQNGQISGTYQMLPPTGDASLGMGFEDFGGFDFSDMQMNFGT